MTQEDTEMSLNEESAPPPKVSPTLEQSPALNEPRQTADMLSPSSMINGEADIAASVVSSLSPRLDTQSNGDVAEMSNDFLAMGWHAQFGNNPVNDIPVNSILSTSTTENPNGAQDDPFESLDDNSGKVHQERKCFFCGLSHKKTPGNARAGVSPCPFIRFLHGIWGDKFDFQENRQGKVKITFTGREKKYKGDNVVIFPNKDPLISWLRLEHELVEIDHDKGIGQKDRTLVCELARLAPASVSPNWVTQKLEEAKALHKECMSIPDTTLEKNACILAVRGKLPGQKGGQRVGDQREHTLISRERMTFTPHPGKRGIPRTGEVAFGLRVPFNAGQRMPFRGRSQYQAGRKAPYHIQ